MIIVEPDVDGTYTEWTGTPRGGKPEHVIWIRDSYTEPREFLFVCADCGELIEEWELYSCLDGGDAAHTGCVEVRE